MIVGMSQWMMKVYAYASALLQMTIATLGLLK